MVYIYSQTSEFLYPVYLVGMTPDLAQSMPPPIATQTAYSESCVKAIHLIA